MLQKLKEFWIDLKKCSPLYCADPPGCTPVCGNDGVLYRGPCAIECARTANKNLHAVDTQHCAKSQMANLKSMETNKRQSIS